MNPQVPEYPTGAPSVWAPNAPAGATVLAPPAYAPPQPPSPPPPSGTPRRPGWIVVWTMFAIALVLAGTATALSIANVTAKTATTTTVNAAPPPPTFSPEQVAAAKTDVCDASINADKAIAAAQRHFFDAARDRHSPEYRPALNNYQLVASIETAYLERHISAAVPQDVKDATNNYIAAETALVEANTRELSDQDAQTFVVAARDSGAKLDKVCE
ncbi:hypothetical protein [Mycobacterium paraintracellulare]|uniref:hypothetical protein n=1 Tax=Mycobacterium paraintracellulare TaxID=1138383 RepID=UPI001936125C|nr:hypothetical protein [Mycobacterium paraintracellulare]BCP14017.1 hypothetical protein MINTM021_09260 [Mycobacterium paraintracellulare]